MVRRGVHTYTLWFWFRLQKRVLQQAFYVAAHVTSVAANVTLAAADVTPAAAQPHVTLVAVHVTPVAAHLRDACRCTRDFCFCTHDVDFWLFLACYTILAVLSELATVATTTNATTKQ